MKMTSNEKIRIAYTYIQAGVEATQVEAAQIELADAELWGDVKCGVYSTERTEALKKHVKALQKGLPIMLDYIEQIEAEIRQMHAEEQIRMETRR